MSTGVTETTASTAGTRDEFTWHSLTAEEACTKLGVDPTEGLGAGEVERRRAEVGLNRLAEVATEPGWHAFLRQYRDRMQLVLVGAAIVSMVALQEFSTGIVILGLTVLNAILGLNQEGKAAESVAALQKMLVLEAHVRRGGELADVPAEGLVPGDIAVFEAGERSRGRTSAARGDARDRGGGADRRKRARAQGRRIDSGAMCHSATVSAWPT